MKIALATLILVICWAYCQADCDLDKYETWKNELYTGSLVADSNFWRYQTQRQIRLTNYLALELATAACQKKFDLLYYYLAGRMGPIDIQHSYKTMCRAECLESDSIHESGMAASGCSCLELSTPEDDPSYHIEGDFCLHNTARILCDRVGYCGVWDCRIDDFMCPRYEWNKKMIPFKGIGTCERGAAARSMYYSSGLAVSISLVLAVVIAVNGL